jgi:hypothetical protein
VNAREAAPPFASTLSAYATMLVMLIAEAEVQTEHASRYVAELCEQFSERARAKPELGVRVERTESKGTVDFGWGRCTMRADTNVLAVRAEADDQAGLQQVQELVRRHLEKHGEAEGLTVHWPQEDPAAADSHTGRRDAMRGFHGRMRH